MTQEQKTLQQILSLEDIKKFLEEYPCLYDINYSDGEFDKGIDGLPLKELLEKIHSHDKQVLEAVREKIERGRDINSNKMYSAEKIILGLLAEITKALKI